MNNVIVLQNVVMKKIPDKEPGYSTYVSGGNLCVLHVRKGKEPGVFIDESESGLLNLPLNERIKARRVSMSMTQVDLAQKAGVTQAMIAIIESGNSVPTLDSVYKLKKALAVGITFFDDYGGQNV